MKVEMLRAGAEQANGLSGRKMLGSRAGLLFTKGRPAFYSFQCWKMLFPIDIFFVDKEQKVFKIARECRPGGFGIYTAFRPVTYAVEITSGAVPVSVGDRLKLETPVG